MPRKYPIEYDKGPPEDGLAEFKISVAVCYSCEEIVGPDHAVDVGEALFINHENHATEILGTWTEVEVIDEERLYKYYKENNKEEE